MSCHGLLSAASGVAQTSRSIIAFNIATIWASTPPIPIFAVIITRFAIASRSNSAHTAVSSFLDDFSPAQTIIRAPVNAIAIRYTCPDSPALIDALKLAHDLPPSTVRWPDSHSRRSIAPHHNSLYRRKGVQVNICALKPEL